MKRSRNDLIGRRVGPMVLRDVVGFVGRYTRILVDCDCGKLGHQMRLDSFLSGKTKSCGCSRRSLQIGVAHGLRRCNKCRAVKAASDFGKTGSRLSPRCRNCRSRKTDSRYRKNGDIKQYAASDFVGRRFGSLVAVGDGGRLGRRGLMVLCDCDCGARGKPIGAGSLITGNSKTCGCSKKRGQLGVPEGLGRCTRCLVVKPVSDFYKVSSRYGRTVRCRPCMKIDATTKRYGISEADYNAMISAQDDACAICETKFSAQVERNVDHNHATGKVRGLLCINCNATIGHAKESPDILGSAIQYLRKHSGEAPAVIHEETSYLDPAKDVLSGWNGPTGPDAMRGSI